jgi:GGDEF domain-containing protein
MTESTDYQIAPIPDNEVERLAALRAAMCAYVPREERFDRITRMAQRMLHVPMALISIVEDDVQWFRSAQGLAIPETARSDSFCGHAIMTEKVFQVRDTLTDKRFNTNPLVLGEPYIRSYCGWPLELAPGLRVGTLCVLDTMPRTFTAEDMEILSDLKHMVESELRVNAMADNQKALLLQSSRAQRKELLDPSTGCWSSQGFEEVIRHTMRDVAANTIQAALCSLRIHNVADFTLGEGPGAHEARAMLITQFIRQRLPQNAVLCRMSGGYACILFAARDQSLLQEQMTGFLQAPGSEPASGVRFSQKLQITSAGLPLLREYADIPAKELLALAMDRLDESAALDAVLR